MRLLFGLLLPLLLTSACGYHVPGHGGTLPGGVERLHIPLFVNRTAEPRLENMLTNRVNEALARHRQVDLVGQADQADAVLYGTITGYTLRPIAYDSNDAVSEYQGEMRLAVELRSVAQQAPLWQQDLVWRSKFSADDNKGYQQDLERAAQEELSLRLADELLYRLISDF